MEKRTIMSTTKQDMKNTAESNPTQAGQAGVNNGNRTVPTPSLQVEMMDEGYIKSLTNPRIMQTIALLQAGQFRMAFELAKILASEKDGSMCYFIAHLLIKPHSKELGITNPKEEYSKYMHLSAEYGHPAALTSLGEAYLFGEDSWLPKKDEKKAFQYLVKGSEKNPGCLFLLGICYDRDLGIPDSVDINTRKNKAFQIMEKLVFEHRYVNAYPHLGGYFLTGLGDFPQNLELAKECLQKGAAAGNIQCIAQLVKFRALFKQHNESKLKNKSQTKTKETKTDNSKRKDSQSDKPKETTKETTKETNKDNIKSEQKETQRQEKPQSNLNKYGLASMYLSPETEFESLEEREVHHSKATNILKELIECGEKDIEAEAYHLLGKCYLSGTGVISDSLEGIRCLKESVQRNTSTSLNTLSFQVLIKFLKGGHEIPLPSDTDSIIQLLRLAANNNNYEAGVLLGGYLLQEGSPQFNPKEAKKLFKDIAAHKNASAANALAMCYLKGYDVEVDPKKAVEHLEKKYKALFEKLTERKNLSESDLKSLGEIENNLGWCLLNGIGTAEEEKVRIERSITLFRSAIEHGSIDAINNLAWCYLNGIGVEQDRKRATECFLNAKEKDKRLSNKKSFGFYYAFRCRDDGGLENRLKDEPADYLNNLALCYFNGWCVEQDYKKAVELFQQAAQTPDNLTTKINLLYCYISDLPEVEVDTKTTLELLNSIFWEIEQTTDPETQASYYKTFMPVLKKMSVHVEPLLSNHALNVLGYYSLHGKGLPVDKKGAYELFSQVGDYLPTAAYNVIVCDYYGTGTQASPDKAFKELVPFLENLGMPILWRTTQNSLPENLPSPKLESFFEALYRNHCTDALMLYAVCLLNSMAGPEHIPLGAQILEFMFARSQDPRFQKLLGEYYEKMGDHYLNGFLEKLSTSKLNNLSEINLATTHFERSGLFGNAKAHLNLAKIYDYGWQKVKPKENITERALQYKKAFKHYQHAALGNEQEAMFKIATYYDPAFDQCSVVEKDSKQAIEWYTFAKDYEPAKFRLAEIRRHQAAKNAANSTNSTNTTHTTNTNNVAKKDEDSNTNKVLLWLSSQPYQTLAPSNGVTELNASQINLIRGLNHGNS